MKVVTLAVNKKKKIIYVVVEPNDTAQIIHDSENFVKEVVEKERGE